jgi:hypothetical protein
MPAAPKANAQANSTGQNAKKTRGGGRKSGAQNFSPEDKEFLVTLLEEIRPIGPEQWEQIVSRYNSEYADPNERTSRDKDGLRTQWYKMLRSAKPTGDPSCPDFIRRAKRLNREIQDEIAMTGVDDDQSASDAVGGHQEKKIAWPRSPGVVCVGRPWAASET